MNAVGFYPWRYERPEEEGAWQLPCLFFALFVPEGFSKAERQVLQGWCSSIAAEYSGDMVFGVTTVLVCKSVLDAFSSAKYTTAGNWGINIVSYQWYAAPPPLCWAK